MVNRIALDFNTSISLLNGEQRVIDFVNGFGLVYLPTAVVGELLYGARNSGSPDKNLRKYKDFIQKCELVDIELRVAEVYSSGRLGLKKIGKPIPENDIWIAATCIAHAIPLFTFDKHFQNVEGLQLVEMKLD